MHIPEIFNKPVSQDLTASTGAAPGNEEFRSLYEGASPTGRFWGRHLYAILSFFIPAFIYLYYLKTNSITPFGPNSIFIIPETVNNASVWYAVTKSLKFCFI